MLGEVVLEIAGEMEADAGSGNSLHSELMNKALLRYAKELRRAVKAAGAEKPGITAQDAGAIPPELLHGVRPQTQEQIFAQLAAKKAVREAEMQAIREDRGEQMKLCVGGPLDGTYIPVPPGGRPGMKCPLPGGVWYQLLEDGNLGYVPPDEAPQETPTLHPFSY